MHNRPQVWKALRPGEFLAEIGALFARYRTGQEKGDGSSVDMTMHWGTPSALRDAIRQEFGATWELFASPLNCDLRYERYCSAHPRDELFGARYDAFSTRWDCLEETGGRHEGESVALNPEYTPAALTKALEWAIASSAQEDRPFSAVAIYPRWKNAAYMNLLGHPNVRLVVEFRRDTFAFIPPSGLGTLGGAAAKWPVMVLEVLNEAGRRMYRREGYAGRVAKSGAEFGALRASTRGHDHFQQWPVEVMARWQAVASYQEAKLGPARGIERPAPPGVGPLIRSWSQMDKAHVHEGVQMYTDGSKMGGRVGAGLYCAHTGRGWTMKVAGPQTVNRAELTAILYALRVARVDQPLILYTDSKVSLDKIRAWVLRPGAQAGDKHADIVEEICTHIARYRSGTLTKLLKVPAHTGVEGNEEADRLAKKATMDPMHPDTNPEIGPAPTRPPRFTATLGPQAVELTHTKRQLREVVETWLRREYELGEVFHKLMCDEEFTSTLDTGPSSWMWRHGGDIPRRELVHILRMRTGEFVCESWKMKRKMSESPACPMPGCGYARDTWAHTAAGLCTFRQPGEEVAVMSGLATERHNAACRQVASAVAAGKMGRWLQLHSFGRTDGEPEGVSVPEWITDVTPGLASAGQAGCYKPDWLILTGWPATAGAPVTRVEGIPAVPTRYNGTEVRIVLADLTFTMDNSATCWEEACKRKQLKYDPLIRLLRNAGWLVDAVVRTICVGHRAMLPLTNREAMKKLGIDTTEAQIDLQRALHTTAARRLAGMIAQTRKMRERHRGRHAAA